MIVEKQSPTQTFLCVVVAYRPPVDFPSLDGRWKPFFYIRINPFAPGDFDEKRVLKLFEWFSGHCPAIKS